MRSVKVGQQDHRCIAAGDHLWWYLVPEVGTCGGSGVNELEDFWGQRGEGMTLYPRLGCIHLH
jgi:hypothetical protein